MRGRHPVAVVGAHRLVGGVEGVDPGQLRGIQMKLQAQPGPLILGSPTGVIGSHAVGARGDDDDQEGKAGEAMHQ